MKVHNKFCVAKAQLDRSINLYFDEDYYCATTLAGASEEILGKFLETKGAQSDLKAQIHATQVTCEILFDQQYTEKDVASTINEVRNWLKHFTDGQDLIFDEKQAAADLIERACTNYFNLTGKETDSMRRFMSSQINLNNAAVRPDIQNT